MTQFQITIPHKKPDPKRQNDNKKNHVDLYKKHFTAMTVIQIWSPAYWPVIQHLSPGRALLTREHSRHLLLTKACL